MILKNLTFSNPCPRRLACPARDREVASEFFSADYMRDPFQSSNQFTHRISSAMFAQMTYIAFFSIPPSTLPCPECDFSLCFSLPPLWLRSVHNHGESEE